MAAADVTMLPAARKRIMSRFYAFGDSASTPSERESDEESISARHDKHRSRKNQRLEETRGKKRPHGKDKSKAKISRRGDTNESSNPRGNSDAAAAKRKRAHGDDSAATQSEGSSNNANIGPDSCRFGKPIRPVDHSNSFDRTARWTASSYRSYAKFISELAKPKEQTYANPRHQIRGLNGDARFARIKEALEGFENKPIELQMLMHQAAFTVEGPLIWGEEYFNNTKLILEREGWTAKISILFILTQRKMGKTYFLGQHAVIHALNPSISDFRIACISKTLDQAILTVAIARKLFSTHAKRSEYSLTVNQVKRIEITKDGMSAEIRAYSGNPDVRVSSPLISLSFFLFLAGWRSFLGLQLQKQGAQRLFVVS